MGLIDKIKDKLKEQKEKKRFFEEIKQEALDEVRDDVKEEVKQEIKEDLKKEYKDRILGKSKLKEVIKTEFGAFREFARNAGGDNFGAATMRGPNLDFGGQEKLGTMKWNEKKPKNEVIIERVRMRTEDNDLMKTGNFFSDRSNRDNDIESRGKKEFIPEDKIKEAFSLSPKRKNL